MPLRERVAAALSRYCMCPPDTPIGVAVSGGADSVALLFLLRELGRSVRVVHVDHQLRGSESDRDREFVAALAERLEVPFDLITAPVAQTLGNLEQEARNARLRAFRELVASGRAPVVATGHTLDDQAETVLYRFLRGAHTAGLAGIRPRTHDGLVRPLLSIPGPELRGYLAALGETWCEDSTNQDDRFRRNQIRHQLLPELQADWNPQLPVLLAHLAEVAQDEEDYWRPVVDAAVLKWLQPAEGGALLCGVSGLVNLPRALARRLLRRAFEAVKGDLRQIDAAHVEAALRLFSSDGGHARVQVPGLDLIRSFDQVRIGPLLAPSGEDRFYAHTIAVPGHADVLNGWRISLEIRKVPSTPGIENEECQYNECAAELDADLPGMQPPFVVRAWRPGDALVVPGGDGSKKIKLLFQEHRVPLWERKTWPVLEIAGTVVWARKFGVAAGWEANAATRRVLQVRESKS